MKQLKFMLAAATAISLATAAQAAAQLVKTEISSENFDDVTTLNDTAAVLALDGFSYEGATASDNESYVVTGGANESANALKVNTGTDPLLRKIYPAGAATGVPLDATKKVYIDTMVQFTVTPYADKDNVTAKPGEDKLMIYLLEVPEVKDEAGTVTTPASTKLMVKAAKYTQGDEVEMTPDSFEETDVSVSAANLTVTPNQWYSLNVVAAVENDVPVFTIFINGKQLISEDVILFGNDGTKFPSLLGKTYDTEGNLVVPTLKQVGFAGEGMVDELVFSQDVEQQTSVDFTFTLKLGEGVSSITYTIGNDEPVTITAETVVEDIAKDSTIVVTATANEWFKITDGTGSYTVTQNETIEVKAAKTANVTTDTDGNVKIEVTENTKPADVGITTGSFAAADTAPAELNKALTWATTKGGATASNVGTVVGNLNFADATETEVEQAYLLNCNPNNAEELKAAKDNFKFDKFDPLNPPTANDFAEKGYNGTVTVQGAATLGAWGAPGANSKFFRAVLTK